MSFVYYYESGPLYGPPVIKASFSSKKKFVEFLQASQLPLNDLNLEVEREWPATFWSHETEDDWHLCDKLSVDPHTIVGILEHANEVYRSVGAKPIVYPSPSPVNERT